MKHEYIYWALLVYFGLKDWLVSERILRVIKKSADIIEMMVAKCPGPKSCASEDKEG